MITVSENAKQHALNLMKQDNKPEGTVTCVPVTAVAEYIELVVPVDVIVNTIKS